MPAKRGSKPDAGIELADRGEAQVGGKAVAVGGAVDGQIVQNDRLAVRGQHDVDLDAWSRPGLCRLEGRQRVLRVVQAVAAVAADVDAPGLAGKEAERHVRLHSSSLVAMRCLLAGSL